MSMFFSNGARVKDGVYRYVSDDSAPNKLDTAIRMSNKASFRLFYIPSFIAVLWSFLTGIGSLKTASRSPGTCPRSAESLVEDDSSWMENGCSCRKDFISGTCTL